MGIGVGGFVMPMLLGTYVIPNFGWRMGYIVSGIISAGVLIPLSLWLIKTRPEEMGLLPDNGTPIEDKQNLVSNTSEPGFKFRARALLTARLSRTRCLIFKMLAFPLWLLPRL
jgi:sugar phosphate permease